MTIKKFISIIVTVGMALGIMPSFSFAEQKEYVNPADTWVVKSDTTEEFDANAAVDDEKKYCSVCGKETQCSVYYVPEYADETACSRGVKWSDGTCLDGVSKSDLKKRNPKAFSSSYTGFHWVKTVCNECGTINSQNGTNYYSFDKNIYELHQCDKEKYQEFIQYSYTPYNNQKHKKLINQGQYCMCCNGSKPTISYMYENHNINGKIEKSSVNRVRFYGTCDICGYTINTYYTTKCVVQNYSAEVDGEKHSISISDLSDCDVETSVKYETDAEQCTNINEPQYTEPGFYSVHYEVTYTVQSKSITENGIGYVWLWEADDEKIKGADHIHDYEYEETILPKCEKGYEIFTCKTCGDVMKAYSYMENMPTEGHDYETTVVKPTCLNKGYTQYKCKVCGDSYTDSYIEPTGHQWDDGTIKKPADCENDGKMEYQCTNCSETREESIAAQGHICGAPANCTSPQICAICKKVLEVPKGHSYIKEVTDSTCVTEGYTTYICKSCGNTYIDNKMPKTEHSYEIIVTEATCAEEGYTTYTCKSCGDTYIDNKMPKTEHNYETSVTEATCTEEGYTTYICKNCGDTYKSDKKAALGHILSEWIIDIPASIDSEGKRHVECTKCAAILKKEIIPPIEDENNTDENEEIKTGSYVVTVTDKDGNSIVGSKASVNENGVITVILGDGGIDAASCIVMVHNIETYDPASGVRVTVSDKNKTIYGVTDSGGKTVISKDNIEAYTDNEGYAQIKLNEDIYNLTIKDKSSGIENTKVIFTNGEFTLILPETHRLDKYNQVEVVVRDKDNSAIQGIRIIIQDADNKTAQKTTNAGGEVILPVKSSGGGSGGSRKPSTPITTSTPVPTSEPTPNPTQEPTEKIEHRAYIEGYNGLFRPESNMTRAEAATIFARLISERNSEEIGIVSSNFKDVDSSSWYSSYIAYLEKYDVISGYDDGTFKPDKSISRAEFSVICTRFYELFADIPISGRNVFSDVEDNHWAAPYIYADSNMEWVEGYDDGTFRPNNNITRAEVVSIINKVLNRTPDKKYINDNLSLLTVFKDVSQTHWAFDNIIEACNTHIVEQFEDSEFWVELT